jgi:tetratricopeptide (TPR) repeat protein
MFSSPGNLPDARRPQTHSRELVLLTTLLLLLATIVFAAFATRAYHKKYHGLADEWFRRGETNFQSGDAAAALSDYRNALIYNPSNPNFQFHLARALACTGRNDEARAYLVSLLSESPGSGQINLELARIAARSGPKSMPEALRYYHAAIYGEWDTDSIATRWQIRREFCDYLLDNNSMNQAGAEMIALADNTSPENTGEQKIAGNLLLRARMWSPALQQFQKVLARDPHDQDALVGAGTAEFQLAQYSHASGYFDRLPRERRAQSDLARMYEASRDVVMNSPFVPGLSTIEKAKRTANAVDRANLRASACELQNSAANSGTPPQTALPQALATRSRMAKDWTENNLRKYPERVEAAMASVFEIEAAAAEQCGEPEGEDYALWLLGQSRRGGLR